MDLVVAVLMVVAAVAAWNLWIYKRSGGWNPLWVAFTATAGAALYLVAGAIGYTLDRHDKFVAHTAWAGHVVWSEILTGLVMGLVAVYCWSKGLQRIRRA